MRTTSLDELRGSSASVIRRFGLWLLLPAVILMYVAEARAGRTDLPMVLELVIGLVGGVTVLLIDVRDHAKVAVVSVTWLSLVLIAAQAHFGLSGSLAATWMCIAVAGFIYFRWPGAVVMIAAFTGSNLLTIGAMQLGWLGAPEPEISDLSSVAVGVRLTVFVAVAMTALAFGLASVRQRLYEAVESERRSAGLQLEAEEERTRARMSVEAAQHLEAVGRLASGVAHDVNNALTIILGNAELLQATVPEGEESLPAEIIAAAEAASQTTRQLLALAQGAVRGGDVVSASRRIGMMAHMLRRLLPDDIELEWHIASERDARADGYLLQQAVLNLIFNARDAMPEGGRLTLSVEDTAPDAPEAGVIISVTDTGHGMDDETAGRALEPFFTTRGDKTGTGLGLPMVVDFAGKAGGRVDIDSRPGAGTTVRIFLPESGGPGRAHPAGADHDLKDLRVLYAEDEELVRRIVTKHLESAGASVTVVFDAQEASQVALSDEFDVLVTDAVMPGGGTADLIREFGERHGEGAVLVVSGQVEEELIRRGIETGSLSYLPKPFTREQLIGAVAALRKAARPTG